MDEFAAVNRADGEPLTYVYVCVCIYICVISRAHKQKHHPFSRPRKRERSARVNCHTCYTQHTRGTGGGGGGGKSYVLSLVSPSSGVTRRTQSLKTYPRSIRDVRRAPAARAPRRPLSLLALFHSDISERTTYIVCPLDARGDGIVRTRSKHPRPRVLSAARVAHPAASRPRRHVYLAARTRSSRRARFSRGSQSDARATIPSAARLDSSGSWTELEFGVSGFGSRKRKEREREKRERAPLVDVADVFLGRGWLRGGETRRESRRALRIRPARQTARYYRRSLRSA